MRKMPILALLVLSAFGAAAQEEPAQEEPSPYLLIHYDRIDPVQLQAWEQNAQEWVAAFAGAEVPAELGWRAYSSNFDYAWVGDLPDYAFLDGEEARNKRLAEMLGEGRLEALYAGGAAAVVEHHDEIWKREPELSFIPAGFDPAGMSAISVATVKVKPSMSETYREVVQEVIAALGKVEAPLNWFGYSTPFGAGSYAYVVWGEDRAALHSGPEMGALLTEAVGAEKTAELFQRYLDCVAGETTRDWMVRPDLTYPGAAAMEAEAEGAGDGG